MDKFPEKSMLRNFLVKASIIFMFVISFSVYSYGQMTVTYRSPGNEKDPRYQYDTQLLKLALEKTTEEYGDYNLEESPSMNYTRTLTQVSRDAYENFVVKFSYEERFPEEMDMSYVKFPVDLGIVGYRVFLTNPETKKELKNVESIEELKNFTMGQAEGWSDIKILRQNGFEVIPVNEYENLFKMVARNRFDLFPRGTNELLREYEEYENINNLTYDSNIALYYPLPRFFFTHKSNKKVIERIQKGLKKAYEDGSLKELWLENYEESLEFVKLENREIFKIENPLIQGIDFDYKKYFYNPNNK